MKAILMALLMVVSFSIIGCGKDEPEVKKKNGEIKKIVTTPPAKVVDDAEKKVKDDAKKLLDD